MSAEATAATATATVEAPPKKKKKFSVPTAFTILSPAGMFAPYRQPKRHSAPTPNLPT